MASPILQNKRILLAKTETTYGVDSVPTGDKAVLCNSITVSPLKADAKERNNIRPFFGANGKVITGVHATVDVEVELAPGGNANGVAVPGTVPQWDPLLAACGYQRVVMAGLATTLQAGSSPSVVMLNAAASSVDGAYSGMSVLVNSETGAAQAPAVAGDKTTVRLAASFTELSSTTGASPASTATAINLGASAVGESSYYVGMSLVIGAESRIISDYDGATKVATVSVAFGGAPASGTAFVVPHKDDYFKGHSITVTHFTGAKRVGAVSTAGYIYLPAAVVGDLVGLRIAVTVGGATELRGIKQFEQASGKCVFGTPVTLVMSGAVTFVISEPKRINAFVGSTRVVTLAASLRFATVASTAYGIGIYRLITNYVGATKAATITPAFANNYRPKSGDTYSINANVKYTPVSNGQASLSLYFYLDDVLHSFVGARGNVSLDFSAGDFPKAKFSMTGLLNSFMGATVSGVNLDGFVAPLPVNEENTRNIIIENFDGAVMEKFSVDTGNTVTYRNLVNSETVRITDRKAKGSITIEATRPDDFNFFDKIIGMSTSNIAFTHGPLGNQVAVFAPKGQLSNPQYSDKDGITMLAMDIDFLPQGDGNNELALILQ